MRTRSLNFSKAGASMLFAASVALSACGNAAPADEPTSAPQKRAVGSRTIAALALDSFPREASAVTRTAGDGSRSLGVVWPGSNLFVTVTELQAGPTWPCDTMLENCKLREEDNVQFLVWRPGPHRIWASRYTSLDGDFLSVDFHATGKVRKADRNSVVRLLESALAYEVDTEVASRWHWSGSFSRPKLISHAVPRSN